MITLTMGWFYVSLGCIVAGCILVVIGFALAIFAK